MSSDKHSVALQVIKPLLAKSRSLSHFSAAEPVVANKLMFILVTETNVRVVLMICECLLTALSSVINAPWGEGAMYVYPFLRLHITYAACSGTAVYRGVPLKKVLKIACGGILPECKHLEFIGADTYFK